MTAELKSPLRIRPPLYTHGCIYDGTGYGDGYTGDGYGDGNSYGDGSGGGIRSDGSGRGESTEELIKGYRSTL